MDAEIEAQQPHRSAEGKRHLLAAALLLREIRHEPHDATCGGGSPMQRSDEDVAEKLNYEPGVLTVKGAGRVPLREAGLLRFASSHRPASGVSP